MMKTKLHPLLATAMVVAATAPATGAEKEVVIRRGERDQPHVAVEVRKGEPRMMMRRLGGEVEMEKAAFLGVQTAPVSATLAAQLGLPRDVGLVVVEVVPDSPAATALKPHDILTRLDDQILVNQRQLAVLVRQRKEGDEITLTLHRAGKETKVKVKLAVRDVPKLAAGEPPLLGEFGSGGAALRELHELPGMEPGQVGDVIRMIGRSRENWFGEPGVHVLRRGEKGATILDLPRGNIVYSDGEGSVEVQAGDGKRELTVKDASGQVVFRGPISTPEERAKLPPEVRQRVERIERSRFSFEVDREFQSGGADLRPGADLRRIDLPAAPVSPARRPAPAF